MCINSQLFELIVFKVGVAAVFLLNKPLNKHKNALEKNILSIYSFKIRSTKIFNSSIKVVKLTVSYL